jgi:hypothetical protein
MLLLPLKILGGRQYLICQTYQFTKNELLLRNKLPPEYTTDIGVSQLFMTYFLMYHKLLIFIRIYAIINH